jgi:hypothetical protein
MATTPATKTLTASELRKLQERAARAAQHAQELEDETFLQQVEVHERAETAVLKDRLTSAMEDASHIDPQELKDDFSGAVKDLAKAKQQESEALDLKNHALVIMSRRAFQASIHPAIVGEGKQNISKAGQALGMPYSTIRPYVLAGGALFQQDRAFLLSEPDAEDARIVNGSFDDHSRKAQIEKRAKAAAKAQAQAELLAKQQAEIEALKQAQAQNGNGQAPAPADAPAPTEAPASGPEAPATSTPATAPATAPEAPADELGVTVELLGHARKLVQQAKFLRKENKPEWTKVQPELIKILGDLFPVLTK